MIRMDYYKIGMELLSEYAESLSYEGDAAGYDALYGSLLDEAYGIASCLSSWGVSDGYAFWLGARMRTLLWARIPS